MAKKFGGLGKGLDVLFSENTLEDGVTTVTLPLDEIIPNRDQPRKQFDDAALADLSDSIAQHGVLQPLLVRPMPDGSYQLVAGERRWRASRMAGLTEVPVVIRDMNEQEAAELALIENLQREDLNPMEEAIGYRTLMDNYGMTQEQAAQVVNKSRPAVANALRLLSLSEAVTAMVENGSLSAGHARTLLGLKDPKKQLELAEAVMERGLSVRQTEALVKKLSKEVPEEEEHSSNAIIVDYVKEVERELENALGRRVRLVEGKKTGRIEIEFYGADDREVLINKLRLFGKMKK